ARCRSKAALKRRSRPNSNRIPIRKHVWPKFALGPKLCVRLSEPPRVSTPRKSSTHATHESCCVSGRTLRNAWVRRGRRALACGLSAKVRFSPKRDIQLKKLAWPRAIHSDLSEGALERADSAAKAFERPKLS